MGHADGRAARKVPGACEWKRTGGVGMGGCLQAGIASIPRYRGRSTRCLRQLWKILSETVEDGKRKTLFATLLFKEMQLEVSAPEANRFAGSDHPQPPPPPILPKVSPLTVPVLAIRWLSPGSVRTARYCSGQPCQDSRKNDWGVCLAGRCDPDALPVG